jgi:hypothetical protein
MLESTAASYMGNFEFTSRTIVEMTGIAATLLLGETTHSGVYQEY